MKNQKKNEAIKQLKKQNEEFPRRNKELKGQLASITKEMEKEGFLEISLLEKSDGPFSTSVTYQPVNIPIKWGRLCSAFLVEAQWFASWHLPKAGEYLKNGIINSGVHVVLVPIFFLLGQGLNKGNPQRVDSNPEIISSTTAFLRLWDDLGSTEDEDPDGHDGSFIKYYMNEHPGSSLEGTRRHVTSLISDARKQLNQECLSPNPFSPTFTKAALNLARMVPLMYNHDHTHRLPTLEEHVKSLLNL